MSTTGYYGKLPLRGDFISGRIPSTFRNTWDDWAQQLVLASERLKAENNGQSPWFQLPVYRFYLSSMVAGDNAWIGIMLPSRDSVGRQFPFCLTRDIDATLPASLAFSQQEGFLISAERLVEQLFGGDVEFESLEPALAELDVEFPSIENTVGVAPLMTRQAYGEAVSIRFDAANAIDTSHFWSTASTAILNTTCTAHTIWTTSPLSNSASETLICEALPSAESCTSMFTAQFVQSHWTSVGSNDTTEQQRGDNAFGQDNSAHNPVPAVVEDDGDTKPIHKLNAGKTTQETDFLEFDEIDDTDAPWDN